MREDLPMIKVPRVSSPWSNSATGASGKRLDRGHHAEDGTISFDQASIGDAVVDGTVECLQGNN